MTTLLILEGNSPHLNEAGNIAARAFESLFKWIDPALDLVTLFPYKVAPTEADMAAADGIVFTGAGVAWSVDGEEGLAQVRAMELALRSGKPIWGSCNGMQLAAHVLGGTVGISANDHEVPLAKEMQITEAGASHPMMAGRHSGFSVPCIHRDIVVKLPAQAKHLAGNAHTPIQAFAYEADGIDLWATQYHPELSLAEIAGFVRARGIFADHAVLAEDLDIAEENAEAAARLGASPEDLTTEARTTELRNWVAHVKAQQR